MTSDPILLASELRQIAGALVDLTPEAKAVLEGAARALVAPAPAPQAPAPEQRGREVSRVDCDYWPAWMEEHPALFVKNVREFLDQHQAPEWRIGISTQGYRIRISAVRVGQDQATAAEVGAGLAAQLAEADRRAGEASRALASTNSELSSLRTVRSRMKREAGYHENVSFDVVWTETLAKAKAAGPVWERLLALASEEHSDAAAGMQHGAASAEVPEWAQLVARLAPKGNQP